MTSTFRAPLWRHDGQGGWCFVTLPPELADEIEFLTSHRRAGFGSVRVEVTVGATTWRTSIFPDTARRSYLLPVKAAVRTAEQLVEHDEVSVELTVLDELA